MGYSDVDEKEYRRKDGTVFPIELRTYLIRDEAGQPESMWALIRDISERKQAEAAVWESEEKYRSLFEASLDATFLTAPDGQVFAANPAACRMFGSTEEEFRQLGRGAVVDASDPRLAPALEERTRTGHYKGELTLIRKDGTRFPGEVSTALFTDKGGGSRRAW